MDQFDNIEVFKSCDLEEGSYASMCFEAMRFLAKYWYFVADSENNDAPVLERNYVLSLVFQLGRMTNQNSEFGTNVFPSGENNKHIDDYFKEISETYKDLYEKELRHPFEVIPDLVIHTSHDKRSIESNGQHVIIEAKTTKALSKVAFFKDLFKLNVYLCSLKFDNAIYLIVYTEKKRIEDLIKLYFKNKLFHSKTKLENLLFFIQDDIETSPYVCKLTEELIQIVKAE